MDFIRKLQEGHSHGGGETVSHGSMSHSSTFSDWNSYKIILVFEGYYIKTPWQFALTCLVVTLGAMFLHNVECLISTLKSSMIQTLVFQNTENAVITGDCCDTAASQPAILTRAVRPRGWLLIKIISSILSGFKYIYHMLMMLVAMSFNPLLVLSLVLGYFIGDYLCCDFHVDMKMGVYNTDGRGYLGPPIRWLLSFQNSHYERDEVLREKSQRNLIANAWFRRRKMRNRIQKYLVCATYRFPTYRFLDNYSIVAHDVHCTW